LALVFDLTRESAFSFRCRVCGGCCRNKAIRVAPYEALRLARNLGVTTTEFYRSYTVERGAFLRDKPDGSCIFLNARGCGVHPDRPLVCRLYPLGQIVDRRGRELFGIMPLHPGCAGLLGTEATVASYLESQEVEAYFRYEKAYSAVFRKMLKMLARVPPAKTKKAAPARKERRSDPPPAQGELLSAWLDIDRTVEWACRKNGRQKPDGLDEAVHTHLRAIKDWLVALPVSSRRTPPHSPTK